LATMCVSTAKQQPLEEIFASQVYGLTVYLKTNTRDRFGNKPSYLGNVLKIKDATNVFIVHLLCLLMYCLSIPCREHRVRFVYRK
jgi:hypothetical protein